MPTALAWACGQRPRAYFHVANIAQLAAVITATVIHPSTASQRGFDRDPMIAGLLVRRSTMTMSGGASTPFRTAAQNSIDTALKPGIIQGRAPAPNRRR